jgi:hypothetical protein
MSIINEHTIDDPAIEPMDLDSGNEIMRAQGNLVPSGPPKIGESTCEQSTAEPITAEQSLPRQVPTTTGHALEQAPGKTEGISEERLAKLVGLSVREVLKSVLEANPPAANRGDGRGLDRLLGNKAPTVLKSNNYHAFKSDFESYLAGFGLDGYITGTGTWAAPGPMATKEEREKFKRDNSACLTALRNSCDTLHKDLTRRCATLKEAFDNLDRIYAGKAVQNTLIAYLNLLDFSWDARTNVHENINRYRELLTVAVDLGKKVTPFEQGALLLAKMPTRSAVWETTKSRLYNQDADKLTLEVVVDSLVRCEQQERFEKKASASHNNHVAQLDQHTIALIAAAVKQSRGREGASPKRLAIPPRCGNCHRQGHKTVDCYAEKREKCPHCMKNHPGGAARCWKLHPELKEMKKGKHARSENANMAYDEYPSDTASNHEYCSMSLEDHYLDNGTWILDSGATSHMTGRVSDLINDVKRTSCEVTLGDKKTVIVGTLRGTAEIAAVPHNIKLENCLYVPKLGFRLISSTKLQLNGYTVTLPPSLINKIEGRGSRAIGGVVNELPRFKGINLNENNQIPDEPTEHCNVNAANNFDKAILWHRRLGHIGQLKMQLTHSCRNIGGLDRSWNPKALMTYKCETCLQDKATKPPYSTSTRKILNPLELVVSDVAIIKQSSHRHQNYFVTFIDAYSDYCIMFLLNKKSEVFESFQTYVAFAERQTGFKMKTFRNDKGGEYVSNEMMTYLREKGIHVEQTCTDEPRQNGKAERKNRTLFETMRCLLHDSGLPHHLWSEVIKSANYILNRVPTKRSPETTPYQRFFGREPNMAMMRIIGCAAYTMTPDHHRTKLDAKAHKMWLVGYDDHRKGWRCYDPATRRIIVSRNVRFDESTLYKQNHIELLPQNHKPEDTHVSDLHLVDNFDQGEEPKLIDRIVSNTSNTTQISQFKACDTRVDHIKNKGSTESADNNSEPDTLPKDANLESDLENNLEPETIKPALPGETNKSLNLTPNAERYSSSMRLRDRSMLKRVEPYESEYANTSQVFEEFCQNYGLEMALIAGPIASEPSSIEEARKCEDWPKWKQAIELEYESLLKNKTWTLAELPKGRKAIGNKWVLKIKRDSEGNIARYKARLVIQGYLQVKGIDYTETFAPVVKYQSLRTLLALAAHYDFEVHQIDFETAFLNSELAEEIYMKQPQGFVIPGKENLCLKLKRSLYGLKQAPREWHKTLHKWLVKAGFTQCKSDTSIYQKELEHKKLIIGVYVDDMVILSKSIDFISEFKLQIGKQFKIKDLGEIKWILNIEVTRDRKNRFLSLGQTQYIKDMVKEFNLSHANSLPVPGTPSVKLSKSGQDRSGQEYESPEVGESTPYLALIGKLLYLSMTTRPDISYIVSKLSRYTKNPKEDHWRAAKQVVMYLNGTRDYKLQYSGENQENHNGTNSLYPDIKGFTDADWGNDTDDRKSIGGWCYLINGCAVNWSSKKQNTVAKSTAEAEYVALGDAASEAIWLKQFLAEIGINLKGGLKLYVDNKAAIDIAHNPKFHNRTKHIDVKYHFVRDHVDKKTIEVEKVQSAENVADIFTKLLTKQLHQKHVKGLGLVSTRGSVGSAESGV